MKLNIGFHEAKNIALSHLQTLIRSDYAKINPPVLMLDLIIDVEWAVIFPYQSERFLSENDLSYRYFCSYPILVNLLDGSAMEFRVKSYTDDFSTFNALKNYAAEKGYPWDKSLEDYLNDQGLYPDLDEEEIPRKFPHRLIQYKPEERERGVFDFDKVENVTMFIMYTTKMNSIEQCKMKLEQEFSVVFKQCGHFFEGVYYVIYKTVFFESNFTLCFNYYKDEYETKYHKPGLKKSDIVFMSDITAGKKEDRVKTYKNVHDKLIALDFVQVSCYFFSD